jgi:hypothetical protein
MWVTNLTPPGLSEAKHEVPVGLNPFLKKELFFLL